MSTDVLENMVELPGGAFRMGSDRFYPEERPVRDVSVDGFWIDRHPVTVAEFRRFVRATGHVSWAEQTPDPAQYPDVLPEVLVPGSLVFTASAGEVDLSDISNWWAWTPGADWRHPEGPASRTPGPTRSGLVRTYRPRPSRNATPAGAWMGRCSVGETSSRLRAG